MRRPRTIKRGIIVKDRKTKEGLLSRQDLLEATHLSPQALTIYEKAGYVSEAKVSDGGKYYSQETVGIIKAMEQCLGRCANLQEAHDMALQAVALKARREEQASNIRVSEGDHHGTINPKKIKTRPTFEGLLPIDEDTLEEIARKMALYGYYESEPILLGKWPGLDHYVVIDGHTRRRAAIKAGIKKVFYVTQEFESESAALEHAMSLQTDRRITEDRHIFQFIERYDILMERGGDRRSKKEKAKPTGVGIAGGRSASAHRTASLVGCNYKKVEKVRRILKDSPATIHNAVRTGKMTINKAYNVTVEKGKSTKEAAAKQAKPWMDQLTNENRADLNELGGDLQQHLNRAVSGYIRWLRKTGKFPEKKEADLVVVIAEPNPTKAS